MSCRSGKSASAETSAYTSVELALSPSTPEYDCSKQMLAASESGLSCASGCANSRNNVHALVVEAPAQIRFALDIDEPDFRALLSP